MLYTQYLSVFTPNAGKYGTEKAPYLDTFHGVLCPKCSAVYFLSDPYDMFISRLRKHVQLTLKCSQSLAKVKIDISIFFINLASIILMLKCSYQLVLPSA